MISWYVRLVWKPTLVMKFDITYGKQVLGDSHYIYACNEHHFMVSEY